MKSDPALSLSLLRYINSGLFRWLSRIDTIHRAVVLLGPDEVRRWVAFMSVSTAVGDNRPRELIVASVARGRFCEVLAPWVGLGRRALDLFFTGLFSLADAMLGMPLEEALEHIPLAPESYAALLRREGAFTPVLELAIAFEHGDWARVDGLTKQLGLTGGDASAAFREAVAWADDLVEANG